MRRTEGDQSSVNVKNTLRVACVCSQLRLGKERESKRLICLLSLHFFTLRDKQIKFTHIIKANSQILESKIYLRQKIPCTA